MSKIKRITHLCNCGIFRDFKWPADLPEFGRYNLIYGWNGTGKTTLSRVFRALELHQRPSTGEVVLSVDDNEVRGQDFPFFTLHIRVFNRDFIEENIFRKDGGDLPPIFVLGKESIKIQKKLEHLKKRKERFESCFKSATTEKLKADRELDKFCSDNARNIKERLRSSGPNTYNNYDKSDFKKDAERMIQMENWSSYRLIEAERDRLIRQHQENPKEKIKEVNYIQPDLKEIQGKVAEALKTTIVSAVIESLKNDLELNEWVGQGLKLHRNRKAEYCLFCEQPLPKDRMLSLESHFSSQYEQFIHRLDQMIEELNKRVQEIESVTLPHKAQFYEDLREEYQAAEENMRKALEDTKGFLKKLTKMLEEKRKRPFDSMYMNDDAPIVDDKTDKNLNAVIKKHNQACDDFQKRVDEARKKIAEDMIAQVLEDFISMKNSLKKAEEKLQKLDKIIRKLNEKIVSLERGVIEHRRPADELNEDLRKYLGHSELQLEVKETGYTIKRGGELAKDISEGEMTAISLLYFLKSLQDKKFDLANGVVVLDDPVSSLDANALYLAFGFIRERTKDAGQLIIFTHNFTFFRQVRNWFHHLKGQQKKDINKRPARFYMLDCSYDSVQRCAMIKQLDSLLEQYDSEYHYLFARIYKAANKSGSTILEDNYALPNMARRLVEGFLAFRKPEISEDLWQKMQSVAFDETKKMRILRFLNVYSHSNAVPESEQDPSLLTETKAVLKDLLEFISTQDIDHYNAMVSLMNSQLVNEDDI